MDIIPDILVDDNVKLETRCSVGSVEVVLEREVVETRRLSL